MTTMATCLQEQLEARSLTQQAVAVYAGALSEIINRGHIPKMETLFRLADYFQTPREKLLHLAARMPIPDSEPVHDDDEYLIEELLEEFRKVPDEWKHAVVQQVRFFRRLSENPPIRFVGEDEPDP